MIEGIRSEGNGSGLGFATKKSRFSVILFVEEDHSQGDSHDAAPDGQADDGARIRFLLAAAFLGDSG